jgi:hypothetical protein
VRRNTWAGNLMLAESTTSRLLKTDQSCHENWHPSPLWVTAILNILVPFSATDSDSAESRD